MYQCLNVNIYNFAIFYPIFMNFSPKCRAKELGIYFTNLGSFAFFIGKGSIFGPKLGLGKSLLCKLGNFNFVRNFCRQLIFSN